MNFYKRYRTYLTLLFLLISAGAVHAQIDTLRINEPEQDTSEVKIKIIPWEHRAPLNTVITSTDSLNRWQIWPNWTYKKNRDPGVISYRLGTVGRSSSLLIDSYESRHQQLFWEDISMNDPVSSTLNWNLIPQHRINTISVDDSGVQHSSQFNLIQYYINKPLTKLIFDESKFDMRSLEFLVSHNFSQKTNAELSFWDRRDGDNFSNSRFQGTQIFAKAFHQFDNQNALKLSFLSNNIDLGEPFGYIIPNLNTFDFDRFGTPAVEPGAQSETKSSHLVLSYYARSPDTTITDDHFQGSLFYNSRSRDLSYSADTTFYDVNSVGATLHKWLNFNPLVLEGEISYERHTLNKPSISNLNLDNWNLLKTRAKAEFSLFKSVSLTGRIAFRNRSDDESDFEAGAGFSFQGKPFTFSVNAYNGTLMPSIQQLYWQSRDFSGNSMLSGEEITGLNGAISFKLFPALEIGLDGQFKKIEDGIVVGSDSTFTNLSEYKTISVTPRLDFNSSNFEFNASATLTRFRDLPASLSQPVEIESETIWFKAGAYWKGPLFNRATFVKAGVSGMAAPRAYRAAHYNPVLDFWQPVSDDPLIPSFNRLDLDISARVRMIMFLLRFENILNEVNQAGYFETAGYPMPPRRFIFGVRALFRN